MSQLYYRERGNDRQPPLLLLHSGGMSGAEWEPQLDSFGQQFRVIAPDQPGHGESPMRAERLTVGDCGRAVLELLDTLAIEQTAVVGSSMGGAVALWLTVNHPQRVSKLVLFRASYSKNEATFRSTQAMADPSYWQRMGMADTLSRLHQAQGGPEAWKTVIGRVMQAHDPATTEHNHSLDTLAKIQQPTLIIAGDRDPVVPLEQVWQLYQTLPNAGLWLLPYTTHVAATNTWRADSFTLEVTRFLLGRGVVKS